MWQYLWILSKKYYDYFILFILALIFFVAYLFLYIRPSVLELSPLNVLSCGNSRLFGQFVERGTVSTIADVEIKCGGIEPLELKEKKVPAYLILNQPDEAINYFFIRQLVFYNQFSLPEDLTALSLSQVHPRSTTVVGGGIVPIGFPGFIVLLSGLIKILSFIFSQNLFNVFAVAITPLLGAITPFLAYYVWRNFWDKKIALTAAVLLFVLPPWWYNASRPFQHNLLFLFFLLVSLTFYLSSLSSTQTKKRSVKVFFSVLFWGLALYVRPSEVVWMSVLAVLGLRNAKKKWPKRELIWLAAGLAVVAILFFATQYAFYGNIFGSGYVRPGADGAAGTVFQGPQGINFLQALFLPFGFHPVVAVKTFIKYFFFLFRPWFWLILAGLCVLVLERFKNKKEQEPMARFNHLYVWLWASIGFYILIYYGSWEFYDNLIKIPSIGTSYVRYFLPIYVFSLPVGAYFLVKLWSLPKMPAKILVLALIFLLPISGATQVYLKLDGLRQVKENVKQYQGWQEKIYQLTEPNAIVVTRYGDKYIFPGRKVISGWGEDGQTEAIANLIREGHPVYFYDLKLDQQAETSLLQALSAKGITLGETIASWDNLQLRKILPL